MDVDLDITDDLDVYVEEDNNNNLDAKEEEDNNIDVLYIWKHILLQPHAYYLLHVFTLIDFASKTNSEMRQSLLTPITPILLKGFLQLQN